MDMWRESSAGICHTLFAAHVGAMLFQRIVVFRYWDDGNSMNEGIAYLGYLLHLTRGGVDGLL